MSIEKFSSQPQSKRKRNSSTCNRQQSADSSCTPESVVSLIIDVIFLSKRLISERTNLNGGRKHFIMQSRGNVYLFRSPSLSLHFSQVLSACTAMVVKSIQQGCQVPTPNFQISTFDPWGSFVVKESFEVYQKYIF